MTMGLALAGLTDSPALAVLALAGSVFYIVHHIAAMTNLFLLSSVVRRLCGTFELRRQGGLYRSYPVLAALFLIPALSLAGVPPLSGFFAKLPLLQAGLGAGRYAIVAVALAAGLLTLFAVTRLWAEAFWKPIPGVRGQESGVGTTPAPDSPRPTPDSWPLTPVLLSGVLAATTAAIGLGAEFVFALAAAAAEQLLDREGYVRAVLGGPP
jgi:multicomponent Na+:H+ antiporter subunit D